MSIIELHGDSDQGAARDCTVDIVAVHGLYEDQTDTWTDAETKVCWLRDLLAPALPRARILSYGYKLDFHPSNAESSPDRILPHALTLVANLYADRDLANATDRPIIFICHGLGGILVKRALAFSNTSKAKQVGHRRSIFTSTYAILFLGTPHYGMDGAVLRAMAQDITNPALEQFTAVLRKDSEVLQDINDQFAPLTKRFSIFFFWEQIESELGSMKAYVVDEHSAAPAWENVERAGISANHSSMCKFTSTYEAGYKLILSACKRYMRRATNVVRIRWIEDQKVLKNEQIQEAEELVRHDSGLSEKGDPRVRPNKFFVVPRSASSMFTGREDIAKRVREKIVSTSFGHGQYQHKIFVIWGLGGSGKTQFCLKFVEDNRESFWGIFWIDASTDETAEMGFATIGALANKDTTFEAGKHWLANCTKAWLLVIDNADARDMDVSKYFPAGGRGHILVTSRNPNTVVHATIGEANFGEMDEEDAITLLLKAAHQPGSNDYKDGKRRELAKPITSALGYLALALIHAGATIRRRLCTLESYLRVYLKEMMSQRSISTASVSDISIIATYEVPFREIEKRHDPATEDAVEILYIFAFFHFQQIPESVFFNAWTNMQRLELFPDENLPRHKWPYKRRGNQTWIQDNNDRIPRLLSQVTWDERRLRDALATLYELSFIYYDDSKQLCWMHPVVHMWARDRLQVEKQKYWLDVATNLLAQSITFEMEPSGRAYRRTLIPHITACLEPSQNNARPTNARDDHVQATQAEKFAAVYAEAGEWKRARYISQKVFDLRKASYGLEHLATLKIMTDLGKLYWDLSEVGKCIEIRLGILNARLRTVGEWSPLTLKAMSDLSVTYWLAGDRRKAEDFGEKAVQGLMKLLGPEDPDTITAMFNVARAYLHLGRPHAALNCLKKVLRVRMEFFGPKHPETLLAMSEMGMTYHSLGRLHEAEELAEAVLATRTQVLGEEHAYTLWAVNDLSKVYTDSGRAEESLNMLQIIMPIVVRTLGYQHIGMQMTKFNLARAFNAAGQWQGGEKILRKQIGNLIPTHPDFTITVAELAWTCQNLGRLEEAEAFYQLALDTILKKQALGVNRRRTRKIIDQLKEIYMSHGQHEKIQEVETKMMQVMRPERNVL